MGISPAKAGRTVNVCYRNLFFSHQQSAAHLVFFLHCNWLFCYCFCCCCCCCCWCWAGGSCLFRREESREVPNSCDMDSLITCIGPEQRQRSCGPTPRTGWWWHRSPAGCGTRRSRCCRLWTTPRSRAVTSSSATKLGRKHEAKKIRCQRPLVKTCKKIIIKK